jgi:putative tricarboxylic transport membrane protein
MAKKEWGIYLVFFLIGVIIIIESCRLGLGSINSPGAGLLPLFIGLILSIPAFLLLIRTFFVPKKENHRGKEKLLGRSVLNVGRIITALVVYVLVLSRLGYLLDTFMLSVFLLRAGGYSRWTFICLASLLMTSISYLIFGGCLHINFPRGFLGF